MASSHKRTYTQLTLSGSRAALPAESKRGKQSTSTTPRTPVTLSTKPAPRYLPVATGAEPTISTEAAAVQVLQSTFGVQSFREGQWDAIQAVLEGKDVFVLMCTGAGKSMCYQLPPLILGKVAIVISPLIALKKKGVSATLLNSNVKGKSRDDLLANSTLYSLIYTTPETLISDTGGALLKRLEGKLALIAIDECHCVSEWGHNFRTAFRKLSVVKNLAPGIPVICLTGTATNKVYLDVVSTLRLQTPTKIQSSFNRPNIYYQVRLKEAIQNCFQDSVEDPVISDIASFVKKWKGESGIIYCSKRDDCDQLAEGLRNRHKISALPYHAGMKDDDRSTNAERWASGQAEVVVATIAFGMGIDKKDVRYIIHYCIPASMEAFYQQSGRAGRDGLYSESVVYFSRSDYNDREFLLKQSNEKKEKSQHSEHVMEAAMDSLRSFGRYCIPSVEEEGVCCRRQVVLRFFGETKKPARGPGGKCCDVCDDPEAVQVALQLFNGSGNGRMKSVAKQVKIEDHWMNSGLVDDEYIQSSMGDSSRKGQRNRYLASCFLEGAHEGSEDEAPFSRSEAPASNLSLKASMSDKDKFAALEKAEAASAKRAKQRPGSAKARLNKLIGGGQAFKPPSVMHSSKASQGSGAASMRTPASGVSAYHSSSSQQPGEYGGFIPASSFNRFKEPRSISSGSKFQYPGRKR